MRKKYKLTIEQQIRTNVGDTQTSITMKARELKTISNLGTGTLMNEISIMINSKIEESCKQSLLSILKKSKDLYFVYSKSNLAYIKEMMLETYPLEVTRAYSRELESNPHYETSKRQLELNKNVAIGNVKNNIEKILKEYSLDNKMRQISKETKVSLRWSFLFTMLAVVFSIVLTKLFL